MRRVGKQIVAITLAAAMMGSLTPEACTFLQNEVVYAAETNGALYENNEEKTVKDIDFSSLKEEDWGKKAGDTYAYTNDAERNVKPNFDLKTRVKISAEAYKTLETEGNYIKLQGVVKLTKDWTYTKGDSWPYLDKNAFSVGEDGNYYADATVKFKDKAAAQLMEIDFEIVGVGFKGDVTFCDVSVINITSAKPELTEQEPTVLSDLKDEAQAAQWKGEEGWAYFHGGTANAAPEVSYDANNGDGRLKVGLNYSANSAETWSEAKVKFTPEQPADISNYNQLSVDPVSYTHLPSPRDTR